MKTFPTLEKLIAVAAKAGHNPNDAAGIIKAKYDFLKRCYADSAPKKLVHIAYVTYNPDFDPYRD